MRWSAARALSWIMRREPLDLRQWASDMDPSLRDAQKCLAAAIASGDVQAWGRPRPHAVTEKMPSDSFRIPGLQIVVGPHGDMTNLTPQRPYNGPDWHSIEFEPDDIKRMWP